MPWRPEWRPGTALRVTTAQGPLFGLLRTANADSLIVSSGGGPKTFQRTDVRTVYALDRHHTRDVILGGVFAGLAGLSIGVTVIELKDKSPGETVEINPVGVVFLAGMSALSAVFFLKTRARKVYSTN
jgi:hypothetical protein